MSVMGGQGRVAATSNRRCKAKCTKRVVIVMIQHWW